MLHVEKANNKIWIISGPTAVGKNWSVLEPLMKLNIPNLVVQDMDRLKDKGQVMVQGFVDAFFKQNKGKDIVLVGVAWWPGENPLKFPEESKRICLYRDPKVIAKDRYERDFHQLHAKGYSISDIEKETAEEFDLYEERNWIRTTADHIVKDIASNYQQGET
jgi:hypothetical protein